MEKVDGPANGFFRQFCDVYQGAFIAYRHLWIVWWIPLPATYSWDTWVLMLIFVNGTNLIYLFLKIQYMYINRNNYMAD